MSLSCARCKKEIPPASEVASIFSDYIYIASSQLTELPKYFHRECFVLIAGVANLPQPGKLKYDLMKSRPVTGSFVINSDGTWEGDTP